MFSNMGFLDSIQAAKEEKRYPIYPRICLWAGKSEDPENQKNGHVTLVVNYTHPSIPGTRLLEPYTVSVAFFCGVNYERIEGSLKDT